MNRRADRGRGRVGDRRPVPPAIPTWTGISPTSVAEDAPPFELTVFGSGFQSTSIILIGATIYPPTVVAPNALRCVVDPEDLSLGQHLVAGANAQGQGNGSTTYLTITEAAGEPSHAAPTLASISPSSVTAGAGDTTVTCTGTGFDASSVVRVGGTPVATTFIDATHVSFVLAAGSLTAPATGSITVYNGPPGGGESEARTFTVNYPSPTTSGLSVASAIVGATDTVTRVTGTGIFAGTIAKVDGTTVASSYVDATHIDVTVPTSVLATTGTKAITIVNPTPGGGTSGAQSFAVNNPAPTTSSLGTATKDRWEGAQTGQTINGSGFVNGSTVYIDGVAATTVFVSATQLQFTIPREVLWENGAKSIDVRTPAPGGGTSNAQTYTVTQPAYVQAEYRADQGRTMNGGTVQVLADRSGRGDSNRNLSQLTPGAQPTYVASDAGYNGQPTLTFDGGDHLQSGAWASPPSNPVRHYWVGHNSAASIVLLMDGIANGSRHGFARNTATAIAYYCGGTSANNTAWDTTSKAVAVCEFNGTSSKFAKSAKTLGALSVPANSMTGYTLGASYGGAFKITGTWAHDIITNASESTAQKSEILDYQGWKYAITIGA